MVGENSIELSGRMLQHESFHLQGLVAIDKVTLNFKMGKIYCIIGSVGCRKSILLQTIKGKLPPSVGHIARSMGNFGLCWCGRFVNNGWVSLQKCCVWPSL